MNKKLFALVVIPLILIFGSDELLADWRVTSGLGIGNQYSGLGFNVGVAEEHTFVYASLSPRKFGNDSEGSFKVQLNSSIGFLTTKLIPQGNNKHAVGISYGAIGSCIGCNNIASGTNFINASIIYGFGSSYVYYFNGLNESGWNIGVSLLWFGQTVISRPVVPMPAIGYQLAF